jgi:uncharacterized protein YjdB
MKIYVKILAILLLYAAFSSSTCSDKSGGTNPILFLIGGGSGTGGGGGGNVSVTGITLNKNSTSILEGSNEHLTATISPVNATNQKVTWSSNDDAKASVSSTGIVAAKKAGTAAITVTTDDGGFTANCTVTVSALVIPVTGVSLNKTSTTIISGNTEQLTATVTPSNATNQTVTWSSNNESKATVNSTGLVIAGGVGTATITATTADGSFTANCTITIAPVPVPVTGVTLNKSTVYIGVGDSTQLIATILPVNATNQNVTWSSGDPSVIAVSSSGLVTGLARGGANVSATTEDGHYTKACWVGVFTYPTVTTASITDIGKNHAKGGGIVTNIVIGDSIEAWGVCWSTSENPTKNDSKTTDYISYDESGGSFTSRLAGLNPNTKYYVRAYASNAGATAYGNQVSFTTDSEYHIRDNGPAGGFIFYDKGSYSDGWRFLEAAPTDQSSGATWGCQGTEISGADGTVVGTGNQNTIDIVNGCSTSGIAAKICADLNLGGYDDWFLPSLDELCLIRQNIANYNMGGSNPAGFNWTSQYWSSSEGDGANVTTHANGIFMLGTEIYLLYKSDSKRVRAARAF